MLRRHSGEWRYSSTILDLFTKLRWVVSFAHRPLYPLGNNPRYPLDRKLGAPQSRSGRRGEEKNLLPLSGIEHRPVMTSIKPSHFILALYLTAEKYFVTTVMNGRTLNLGAVSNIPFPVRFWGSEGDEYKECGLPGVTPCSLIDMYQYSKKPATSIFRVF
jgi:hypothetical protein